MAYHWAQARVLRIADGPDEVHARKLWRGENNPRGKRILQQIIGVEARTERLYGKYRKKDMTPSWVVEVTL